MLGMAISGLSRSIVSSIVIAKNTSVSRCFLGTLCCSDLGLAFRVLFAFAGATETVFFALFFAWVAFHEPGFFEHWA